MNLRNLLKADFKKIFFLKSAKIYLISTIFSSLLLGLLFSLTTNVTQGKVITELSPMDVFSANMLGVDLTNIMLIIFPALMIAKEFSTGLINISLIVTPNRKQFFTTKLLCYVLLSALISLVTIILLFLSTQLILAANGMQLIELTDSAILQFMSDVFVMPIFYTIITVAATFLFKNIAGGITFTLGIMVLPSLVKMFPDSIQRLFLPIFPQSAIHSISGVLEQGSPESLGIIFSIVILFIWIAATSLVANVKFQKQDI